MTKEGQEIKILHVDELTEDFTYVREKDKVGRPLMTQSQPRIEMRGTVRGVVGK